MVCPAHPPFILSKSWLVDMVFVTDEDCWWQEVIVPPAKNKINTITNFFPIVFIILSHKYSANPIAYSILLRINSITSF